MSTLMQVLVFWNIRGLRDPVKRQAMFTALKLFSPFIICLQETHLNTHKLNYLKSAQYSSQYYSTYTTYSRGLGHKPMMNKPGRTLQSRIFVISKH